MINQKIVQLFLVKFPILFPTVYGFILYTYPNFEKELILITILLFAETHFAATWPFFVNKVNYSFISEKKNELIFLPSLIVLFSIIGFFLFKNLFLLIFFAANMFHVTRQSFGVCKLYCKNILESKFQEYSIYFFNLLFFFIAFFRFYIPLIKIEHLQLLNIFVLMLLSIFFIYYILKFKLSQNLLVFITGCIIFFPVCFVENPVHAIIMGVTMHYTQYLYLTNYVYKSRKIENKSTNLKFFRYFLIIIIYALIMTFFSYFGKYEGSLLKNLIIIPILGQMLHFYLDSQLWKFSIKHNRDNILKHLHQII
tara:strand:- start:576 stop:1505 length:930 start_codon:yes stop_codon:yes gene_type:complete